VSPCVNTGKQVPYSPERTRHFLKECEKDNTFILLPTPVIAEFLVCSEDCNDGLRRILTLSSCLQLAPFDQKAAFEHALMTRAAIESKDGKRSGIPDTWQKVKFDRQIIAITISMGAKEIYCADLKLSLHAKANGLTVRSFSDMELPPEIRSPELNFSSKQSDAGLF
jgi:hypothetical protein